MGCCQSTPEDTSNYTPVQMECYYLKKALDAFGTDEEQVTAILTGRNKEVVGSLDIRCKDSTIHILIHPIPLTMPSSFFIQSNVSIQITVTVHEINHYFLDVVRGLLLVFG